MLRYLFRERYERKLPGRKRLTSCMAMTALFMSACSFPHAGEMPFRSTEQSSVLAVKEAPAVSDLHTSLLPREKPQPYRISVHEDRETTTHDGTVTKHVLEMHLSGKLRRTGDNEAGDILASMTLDRVQMRYGTRPGGILQSGAPNEKDDNPIGKLLEVVRGAELQLRLSPSGELLDVSGLNARWRKAGMLMAPPALLQVQWMFRDHAMRDLLAEVLFPPLTSETVAQNDTWKSASILTVPVVARLKAETTNTVSRVRADHDGAELVHLVMKSAVRPADPILPGREPSLKTEVIAAEVAANLELVPASGAMASTSMRNLELEVRQVPPKGELSPPLTIKIERKCDVARGKYVWMKHPR